MTGRDLVSASLRLIGALASGESLDSSMATDGLASINRMIDSWSTEGLLIYAITQENPITLTGGVSAYTLGAGGNLTTRPMEIVKAFIRDGQMDYPIDIISVEQFANIPNKSIQSAYPDTLYDDGGYPQRTITLFPTPSTAKTLILETKRPLTTIATLTTTLSFPPGYERALVYNGAIELSPEYGKTVPPEVAAIAIQSKAEIKRANYKPKYLECDKSLVGHGHFSILTGGYTR